MQCLNLSSVFQDWRRALKCPWRTPSFWLGSWMRPGGRWAWFMSRTANDCPPFIDWSEAWLDGATQEKSLNISVINSHVCVVVENIVHNKHYTIQRVMLKVNFSLFTQGHIFFCVSFEYNLGLNGFKLIFLSIRAIVYHKNCCIL